MVLTLAARRASSSVPTTGMVWLSAPAAPTAGLEMTGHVKLADGVYQTTFSNGMRVVVNYTGQPYTGPGVHVEAENYAVL